MKTLKINRKDLHQVVKDIKAMNVKHGPFRKSNDVYYIDILEPERAYSMFLLKYCFD